MERSNSLTDLIHIVDVALYTTTYPKLVEYLNTINGMVDMVPIKDGITALVKCCLFMDAMHAPERVIPVVTCVLQATALMPLVPLATTLAPPKECNRGNEQSQW